MHQPVAAVCNIRPQCGMLFDRGDSAFQVVMADSLSGLTLYPSQIVTSPCSGTLMRCFFPPVFNITSQRQTWTNAAATIQRRPYGNNEVMSGIIAPSGAISTTLQFTLLSTESGLDVVTLSSCTTVNCSQVSSLGSFSGEVVPSPVTSTTGIMLIQWRSDSSIVLSGWSATWTSRFDAACEFSVTFHCHLGKIASGCEREAE